MSLGRWVRAAKGEITQLLCVQCTYQDVIERDLCSCEQETKLLLQVDITVFVAIFNFSVRVSS